LKKNVKISLKALMEHRTVTILEDLEVSAVEKKAANKKNNKKSSF